MDVPIFWVLSVVLVLSVHHHAFELAPDAEGAHILRNSGSDSSFIQMLQNMMGQAANFMPPQIGRGNNRKTRLFRCLFLSRIKFDFLPPLKLLNSRLRDNKSRYPNTT